MQNIVLSVFHNNFDLSDTTSFLGLNLPIFLVGYNLSLHTDSLLKIQLPIPYKKCSVHFSTLILLFHNFYLSYLITLPPSGKTETKISINNDFIGSTHSIHFTV